MSDEQDDDIPTDDFGNPLTTCTGCGQITQCARGLCWWCLVSEEGGLIMTEDDEDEAETYCLQCRRYCDPEELTTWKICWMCLDENEEDDTCPGK